MNKGENENKKRKTILQCLSEREWNPELGDLGNEKERTYTKAHGLKPLYLITYCHSQKGSVLNGESKNIELGEMKSRIVVARGNEEMLVKGFKLSIIRWISLKNLMCTS